MKLFMEEKLDLIVLAAGKGVRMKSATPKQFLPLCGKPILIHTLSVFEAIPYIGTKIITCETGRESWMQDLFKEHGITNVRIVEGGATRQESVWLALQHVSTERIISHNAVLPFVTRRLVDNVVKENYDCVTTVTPVHKSVCRGNGFAEEVLNRSELCYIDSPQSFHTEALYSCHERARHDEYSAVSDCQLLVHYGHRVRFVRGNETNFKITTPSDLIVAEAIMQNPSIRLDEEL